MTVALEDAAAFATPPFHRLVPVTASYRTAPIAEAFNWSYALEDVVQGRWLLIVFRSVRRAEVDDGLLARHDDLAFAEALASGGLARYYKGALDRERRCLSLCVWNRLSQARIATRLPEHRAAAALAPQYYESYQVERHTLRKRRGSTEPEITWA